MEVYFAIFNYFAGRLPQLGHIHKPLFRKIWLNHRMAAIAMPHRMNMGHCLLQKTPLAESTHFLTSDAGQVRLGAVLD